MPWPPPARPPRPPMPWAKNCSNGVPLNGFSGSSGFVCHGPYGTPRTVADPGPSLTIRGISGRADPLLGAVAEPLVLPDRHLGLEGVDQRREASNAVPRCADVVATTTAMSPMSRLPTRCTAATPVHVVLGGDALAHLAQLLQRGRGARSSRARARPCRGRGRARGRRTASARRRPRRRALSITSSTSSGVSRRSTRPHGRRGLRHAAHLSTYPAKGGDPALAGAARSSSRSWRWRGSAGSAARAGARSTATRPYAASAPPSTGTPTSARPPDPAAAASRALDRRRAAPYAEAPGRASAAGRSARWADEQPGRERRAS